MMFMCIGTCGRREVEGAKNIPAICSCGLMGRWSYYPREYIMDVAEKLYLSGKVESISDGYITIIKELRKKIPK